MEDKFILTLEDNNKYLVISKTIYNGITYCYIGKLDDNTQYHFAQIINDNIELITDQNLINELTPLLVDNI